MLKTKMLPDNQCHTQSLFRHAVKICLYSDSRQTGRIITRIITPKEVKNTKIVWYCYVYGHRNS